MKLNLPCNSLEFDVSDINGNQINIAELRGKPIILSFFRDLGCPFSNLRVFEFTRRSKEWKKLGIEVIAVSSSSTEDAQKYIGDEPLPYRIIADPDLRLHKLYGLKKSLWGYAKGCALRMPQLTAGKKIASTEGVKINNRTLLPADFLIGFDGKIVDLWYGKDVGDHIPISRIELFTYKVKMLLVKQRSRSRKLKMQQTISRHKREIAMTKVS